MVDNNDNEVSEDMRKVVGDDYDQFVDAMADHAMSDIRGVAVVAAGFKMAVDFIDSLEGDRLAEWVGSLSDDRAMIVGISNRVAERAVELLEVSDGEG